MKKWLWVALCCAACSSDSTPKEDPTLIISGLCGNGTLEMAEVCDGENLNGASCTSLGFGEGTLLCNAQCSDFDRSQCGAPESCGDDEIQDPEFCDGSDVGDTTCESLGFVQGIVTCFENCLGFDSSFCRDTDDPCGNAEPDDGEVCDSDIVGCDSLGLGVGDARCALDCQGYETDTCRALGSEFAETSIAWSLPNGGGSTAADRQGWYSVANAQWEPGSYTWVTMDLDGDGLPDIVSTASVENENGQNFKEPHGNGTVWLLFKNNGAGFDAGTPWSLPEGDGSTAADRRGFYDTTSELWDVDSYNWVTVDIDGDGLPDLVSTNVVKSENGQVYKEPHGAGSVWLVFKNNGAGFDTGTPWSLPEGGSTAADRRGFYATASDTWDEGTYNWVLIDIDGDGRPDLVSTSAVESENNTVYKEAHGNGTVWLVFKNNGAGFDAGTPWSIPEGGSAANDRRGFYATDGDNWEIGSYNWTTMDIDGDKLPDLVSTNVVKTNNNQTLKEPHGNGTIWFVFKNNGAGFDSGTPWSLPQGGGSTATDRTGWYSVANSLWDVGSYSWVTFDLDGDGRPDLVSTNEVKSDGQNTFKEAHGSGTVWLMFRNTGSGFETGAPWGLPILGGSTAPDRQGWYATSNDQWDLNTYSWVMLDINGDGRSDLVSTSVTENQNGNSVKAPHSGDQWRVYLNQE